MKFIQDNEHLIQNLRTGIEKIEIISAGEKIENTISTSPLLGINTYILMEGLIDIEKETLRIAKEIENIEKFVSGLESRLNNKDFVAKAPEQVISQQRESLAKKQAELAELKKHLESLQ